MSARTRPAVARRSRRVPVVGITADRAPVPDRPPRYELNCAYADAVLLAQGLPVILPYAKEPRTLEAYVGAVDALVISGGAFDLDPALYGEKRHPRCGPAKKERTDFEIALLERALERDLPVLGVCGGMQLLNVLFGGSLVQDLASERPESDTHEQKLDRHQPSHAVNVRRATRLARAVGEGQLMVNSTHHQAVRRLGEGLVASAQAPDGVVEGIEAPGYRFCVGVQWHPELLSASVPLNLGLYRALVKAAARRG